ncbi:interferon-activable protein [Trema orientale]|uniref:Interferon-activable protein n=1 Tax=Trema orientale TaxID=63057 RepID=A0A2P5E6Y3_TREOI|nr:interferon-activable protein [Trema orientale]
MEPAKIDWKNLDSRYVEDELYEHINAPKWFDFLSPNDNLADDDAWFCRPGCNHPKTAQDFLKSTPSKLASPAGVPEISPLGDRGQREAKLKRRGLAHAWISPNSNSKFNEDGENQDPNLSTPSNNYAKIIKAAIKSSTEKKEAIEDPLQRNNEALPRLKSTLSARNLFAGRDILNQITEFCNELKRMATKTRERDSSRKSVESVKQNVVGEKSKGGALGELDWKGNERKPLLDGVKEKPQEMESNILKEKPRRKKRTDDAENIPISVNLVLENVKRKGNDNLLQIRTNPPSPQCFSATRGGAPGRTTTTPSKLSKSKLMERGILQEQNKQVVVVAKEESIDKNKSVSIVDAREEARTLDVFWFLKPCTLSTYNA